LKYNNLSIAIFEAFFENEQNSFSELKKDGNLPYSQKLMAYYNTYRRMPIINSHR
jgi:hypothetical protein